MEATFWDGVIAGGHRVPDDRPLADLTAELTAMLGAPEPHRRVDIAYLTLRAWIAAGVYDDLLEGLGDGMAVGLDVGIGEDITDSVFRRSYSAGVLAACLERDNATHVLVADTVLRWGDRAVAWLVRERDLREYVAGKGWARAVAHGADAIGMLAGSRTFGATELTVLLDVLAERLGQPTTYQLSHDQIDRLAVATMRIFHRGMVEENLLERWFARVAESAAPVRLPPDESSEERYVVAENAQSYLRALHLQLAIAADPPPGRTDLLLEVIGRLKETNARVLIR